LDSNSWNGVTGVPGWVNDITSSVWSGDTSGWDSLHTLGVWETDGHISFANIDAFVIAVKAKINSGAPIGAAIDGGHTGLGHPASVTIATFDNTDFNGKIYATNDIGALAA